MCREPSNIKEQRVRTSLAIVALLIVFTSPIVTVAQQRSSQAIATTPQLEPSPCVVKVPKDEAGKLSGEPGAGASAHP